MQPQPAARSGRPGPRASAMSEVAHAQSLQEMEGSSKHDITNRSCLWLHAMVRRVDRLPLAWRIVSTQQGGVKEEGAEAGEEPSFDIALWSSRPATC